MAFGVLFDFKGNSNVSKVTTTKDLVQEQWFLDAINYKKPIDLFVVIGHNPVRANATTSTFGTLFSTIRKLRPDIPIQAFGGHTHIRDFTVYDNKATGLESGNTTLTCPSVSRLLIPCRSLL
jgi:2',3'-cyclic-nucleotide 2'-phosphodiesterase (5'-nucleotidase family)